MYRIAICNRIQILSEISPRIPSTDHLTRSANNDTITSRKATKSADHRLVMLIVSNCYYIFAAWLLRLRFSLIILGESGYSVFNPEFWKQLKRLIFSIFFRLSGVKRSLLSFVHTVAWKPFLYWLIIPKHDACLSCSSPSTQSGGPLFAFTVFYRLCLLSPFLSVTTAPKITFVDWVVPFLTPCIRFALLCAISPSNSVNCISPAVNLLRCS